MAHLALLVLVADRKSRRRGIRRWPDNISLDGLDDVAYLVFPHINEEVRIRTRPDIILIFWFAENLVSIVHHGDAVVVVLAPNLFDMVVDVYPIVAAASATAVEEGSVQAVGVAEQGCVGEGG